MKHTKGEWKFIKGGNFSGTYVNYIDCSGICIAQTRGDTNDISEKENIANAKLIAAAPELLAMLIKIGNIENHAFTLKGFDVVRLKKEVNEVIKKSTK